MRYTSQFTVSYFIVNVWDVIDKNIKLNFFIIAIGHDPSSLNFPSISKEE